MLFSTFRTEADNMRSSPPYWWFLCGFSLRSLFISSFGLSRASTSSSSRESKTDGVKNLFHSGFSGRPQ